MSTQKEWHEYIEEWISLQLWRGCDNRHIAEIQDDVNTLIRESEELENILYYLPHREADCRELGYRLKELFDSELKYYCQRHASELMDIFSEQWQDYKDSGLSGDECDT